MRAGTKTLLGIAALLAAACGAVALAASASANITIYNVAFNKPAQVGQLTKAGGGKRCTRRHVRQGTPRLQLRASQGPISCRFRPPVQGVAPGANQIIRVDGRIADRGPRRRAFLVVRARAGAGGGYTFRVWPNPPNNQPYNWQLRRAGSDGSDGGPHFPHEGMSPEVNGIGAINGLRLVVDGNEVRVFANGRNLINEETEGARDAAVDADPQGLVGRMIQFGIGHDRNTQVNLFGSFTRLRVGVPGP